MRRQSIGYKQLQHNNVNEALSITLKITSEQSANLPKHYFVFHHNKRNFRRYKNISGLEKYPKPEKNYVVIEASIQKVRTIYKLQPDFKYDFVLLNKVSSTP